MKKKKVAKSATTKRGQEKSKLGATRVNASTHRIFSWTLVLGVSVACVFIAGAFFLIQTVDPMSKLQGMMNRPIAKVNVEGEFKRIGRSDAQTLVNENISKTFFDLNIKRLCENIETHPWIDKVSVRRQWPDTLVIQIKEQKAIARWGEGSFLNVRGDVIELKDRSRLTHLPLLTGDDLYAKKIMQQYLLFTKLLSPYELSLAEIALDETLSWSVTIPVTSNNIKILLGRQKVHEKLQKLTYALRHYLESSSEKISKIDMRYSNGFAVEWNDALNEKLSSAQVSRNETETTQHTKQRGG